ncbi:MAG: copper amine oxidase N-terminal domain-containing protein [Dethiobacter sp.]|nr:copper amine oxidase N-terminal domain-containing protein [Dethiobacter sp.]
MQFDSSYVMLPYRAIAERLGARVSWDSRTRAVTVTKGNDVMRLTVGQKAATVRDRTVTLEAAPLLVSGRVLVPLRFLGEGLGYRVAWDGSCKPTPPSRCASSGLTRAIVAPMSTSAAPALLPTRPTGKTLSGCWTGPATGKH